MTEIEQSHHKFLALVTSARLRPIPVANPSPDDYVLRATTVTLVCSAVKEYLTRIVEEAAEDCHYIDARELIAEIDAALADLSGDVAGAMTKAAHRMDDDRLEGISGDVVAFHRFR